jgi:hypothetical protein
MNVGDYNEMIELSVLLCFFLAHFGIATGAYLRHGIMNLITRA